ncbi:unnamed protein product [Amoebophrya sp. A25]|nr:unnamed protein product [Amoebophrya sp. A25]|eukprot:GSA25T00003954001.1
MWNVPHWAPPIESGSALGTVGIEELIYFALNGAGANYVDDITSRGVPSHPSNAETEKCRSAADIVTLFKQLVESGIKNTVRRVPR